MSLAASFRPAARDEFVEAAAWYESRQDGLGAQFVAQIDRAVAMAASQPERFPVVHRGIRRIVVRQFPYCIYFQVEPERIVVLAVFHGRRSPVRWQGRG
jgi:plasmid stabilization system protein ParE